MGFNNDELSDDTLPEAIDCVSCQDVIFDGITVRHTSASGILLASGSGDIDRPPVNNKVMNSAFYDIGDSGIRIGRHPLGSDRSNHVIQIRDHRKQHRAGLFARLRRGYRHLAGERS